MTSDSIKHTIFKQWDEMQSDAELPCPLKPNFSKLVSTLGLTLRRMLSPTTVSTWGLLWNIWKIPKSKHALSRTISKVHNPEALAPKLSVSGSSWTPRSPSKASATVLNGTFQEGKKANWPHSSRYFLI